MAKTFIEGKEILNLPEHSRPSDITKINFLLAECDALNKAIENPALPPRVILAEIGNKYVYRANDVFTHRANVE